jgi:hypothetical protein
MESLFERLLREKIILMQDMRRQTMEDPGFGSYEEYKYNLGYLEALRRVLDVCEEVQSNMRKE